ncbi:hypothetical protein FQZ97_1061140 [compost metagenome]
MAERAGQRAADLRRDTQCAAILLGDVDGFHLDGREIGVLRIAEAEQPLAGAIARHLFGDNLRTIENEGIGQLLAHGLRHIGHTVEIGGAVDIEPVPQLVGAHARFLVGGNPGRRQRLGEERLAQANQRRPACHGRADGGRMVKVQRNAHGVASVSDNAGVARQ